MSDTFDIVVAGGGIAGLTAGLIAARLGRKTLVLTGDVLGGQLLSIEKVDGIPGHPDGIPGYDLCPIAQEQAGAAGAEFAATTLQSLARDGDGWRLVTGDGALSARAVIVATGATLKPLGVPGEERSPARASAIAPPATARCCAIASSRSWAAATPPCRKR